MIGRFPSHRLSFNILQRHCENLRKSIVSITGVDILTKHLSNKIRCDITVGRPDIHVAVCLEYLTTLFYLHAFCTGRISTLTVNAE